MLRGFGRFSLYMLSTSGEDGTRETINTQTSLYNFITALLTEFFYRALGVSYHLKNSYNKGDRVCQEGVTTPNLNPKCNYTSKNFIQDFL
jgi:hypothetical protein